jgi:hypothetical protein
MADLSVLPVNLQTPLNPYHWEYDNIPLKNLRDRDTLINNELERNTRILKDAAGDQGDVANRLAQFVDESGNLLVEAVDLTSHNIAEHEDGTKELTIEELDAYDALGYTLENPVEFVRMLQAERDKLSFIVDEANKMQISVETPSAIATFENGPITFEGSTTISWDVVGNAIKPVLVAPPESIHRHYYEVTPTTEDYLTFDVTAVAAQFIEGTLRVFINGVRLSSSFEIYVPGSLTTDVWTLNSFTEDAANGTFVLTRAITSSDLIFVDFDITLD